MRITADSTIHFERTLRKLALLDRNDRICELIARIADQRSIATST